MNKTVFFVLCYLIQFGLYFAVAYSNYKKNKRFTAEVLMPAGIAIFWVVLIVNELFYLYCLRV